MLRVIFILFFIAHGLVHVAIWTPKFDPERVVRPVPVLADRSPQAAGAAACVRRCRGARRRRHRVVS